jgi:hypothetical protein
MLTGLLLRKQGKLKTGKILIIVSAVLVIGGLLLLIQFK